MNFHLAFEFPDLYGSEARPAHEVMRTLCSPRTSACLQSPFILSLWDLQPNSWPLLGISGTYTYSEGSGIPDRPSVKTDQGLALRTLTDLPLTFFCKCGRERAFVFSRLFASKARNRNAEFPISFKCFYILKNQSPASQAWCTQARKQRFVWLFFYMKSHQWARRVSLGLVWFLHHVPGMF